MILFHNYYTPFEIQDLIAKSDYIQKFCINEKIQHSDYLFSWAHHLPLKNPAEFALNEENWNLPEDVIETISKYLKVLEEYAEKTCSFIMKNNIPELKAVLPPWIVFPLYPRGTMGWRMGRGEDYGMAFGKFIRSLSEKEREIYMALYPEPQYFKDPIKIMFDNFSHTL